SSTSEFFKEIKTQACTPIVKALRQRAREVSANELDKAIKKGYLKNSDKEEARKLIHQVFKAFLHTPSVNLKNLDDKNEIDSATSAVLDIFGLNEIYESFVKEDKTKETELENEI
ncbi:MAG: glutamyl-tRNA reductase, partial [Campylobacter sp.]|nr:glutamyl-tRNA reductase [Campylobacter sp.]